MIVYSLGMNKRLEDIGEIILGHTFREAIVDVPTGNYAILQAKNIGREGVVATDDLVSTLLEGTKTNALVYKEDVILSNRGTFRAAVFNDNRHNVLAASSVYIIRIHNREQCLPEYLAIFLNSHEGQNLLEGMNRGTIIKSLPKRSLSELFVPIPSLATQKTVISIYKNFHSRAALYERKFRLEEAVANQSISSLISQ